MRRWLQIGALGLVAQIAAQAGDATIQQVVDLVRAAIEQHTADKALAKSLRKVTLTEKLDLRTVEELESEGAGPEAISALDTLMDDSARKPVSTALPAFKSPPRPSIEEQKEFFRRMDVNAMHYSASLPDFICTEVVRRLQFMVPRPPGTNRRGAMTPAIGEGAWLRKDILTVKLSYFDNREKYELILVNGHKTRDTYQTAHGAISEGDFGSTLLEVFAPESATKFQWDHWTHLRRRLTRVYSYRTNRDRSHFRIGVGDTESERKMVVAGRHGFVYADDETQMVMRLTGEAEDIPLGFPITAESSVMDYDYANVGDRRFLLPLRVDNRMETAQVHFRNLVEFRDYRKFTGESTISFEGPDIDAASSQGKPAAEKK